MRTPRVGEFWLVEGFPLLVVRVTAVHGDHAEAVGVARATRECRWRFGLPGVRSPDRMAPLEYRIKSLNNAYVAMAQGWRDGTAGRARDVGPELEKLYRQAYEAGAAEAEYYRNRVAFELGLTETWPPRR